MTKATKEIEMPATLHAVGLVVKDMARSLEFYRTLGLDIPSEEEHAPHVEFSGTGGLVMGFDTEDLVRRNDPQWIAPTDGQLINLQFDMGEPSAVDATHARLIAFGAGEYAKPWDAFWGQRFSRVSDPDGNVVNLFAELDARR